MNKLLLFILLLVAANSHCRNESTTLLIELDYSLRNKNIYELQKEEKITNILKRFTDNISLLQEYYLNESLIEEYQKYKLNSAIHYAKRNIEIAYLLNNNELLYPAQIHLALLYSSSGKYRESEQLLTSIDTTSLSKPILAQYYETYYLFFCYYASNAQTNQYDEQIEQYCNSLLSVLKPESNKYTIIKVEQDIRQKNWPDAEKSLLNLLPKIDYNTPEHALTTYLLGYIYQHTNRIEEAIEHFTLSATNDIKNSLKDNASIQILASIFYEQGDINRAYKYIQSAIEDAVFCNVQFRTIRISEFYTIINTAYLDKEFKQKSQLQIYLILISLLSFFLIMAIIYVYRQMKKVSRIRKELYQTNDKLRELNVEILTTNKQLQERNAQLTEANLIKEEYIAHFFDLCSTYINKLEDYRKSLNKKANERQLDELFKMLKSTTIVKNELEELYSNFDTIFINLYPSFVEEFNNLLSEEERVILKPGEILNTELRIFALIRLGITDSVKIAAFLRYSLSTIYNYRTKARNKAAVSRDEFEKMVMKIGISSISTH